VADPFIGEIRIFAGNFAIRDWAFCDGALLPISQFTALFSIVGTIYGGDGRTTFGLPDLTGRAPMHPGSGPGLTPRSLGERGGATTETLTAAQLPPHSHALRAVDADAQDTSPAGNRLATSNEDSYDDGNAPNVPMSSLATGSFGNQSHDNMQPYLTLNFIIALAGTYPTPG